MASLPLLLLLWAVGSQGFPAASDTHMQEAETVQKYLENYYNLKRDGKQIEKQKSADPMTEKLKQMQQFFGLKVTGKPDAETLNIMKQPRCGVSDVRPRYGLLPGKPRWEHTDLTYRIENYTPDIPRADVDHAIEKAFLLWSNVSPLTFSRVFQGDADIVISFVWRDHYDNSPFDGPDGILAHAFQPGPGIGGDVHFDEEERWTNNIRNYNLYRVAAHELGHSLGLSHSTDIGALMYPNYIFSGDVELNLDDINGIQALYGPSKTPIAPDVPQTPQVCDNKLTFDAITTVRGEMMFLKDKFYMRVSPYFPEVELNTISVFWPHLPKGLQAAYEVTYKDEVRFFKDNKYWAVQGYNPLYGFPKDIHSSFGFPRSVKHIDAAVSEEETGKTYFFVANQYWRYDEYKRSMDAGYPKMIADDFPGIGKKVDAVFMKDGFFYFFHGTRQYKFDPKTKRILTLLKSNSWFNCRK